MQFNGIFCHGTVIAAQIKWEFILPTFWQRKSYATAIFIQPHPYGSDRLWNRKVTMTDNQAEWVNVALENPWRKTRIPKAYSSGHRKERRTITLRLPAPIWHLGVSVQNILPITASTRRSPTPTLGHLTETCGGGWQQRHSHMTAGCLTAHRGGDRAVWESVCAERSQVLVGKACLELDHV